MHAIRLARGHTGRDAIVKIDGCYHGAHDSVLVKAGSGVATFAKPGSPGIPTATAELTLTAPFNDLDTVESHLKNHQVAAVILEPVPGNMGCISPREGYFEGLSKICQENGTLLIIDEVMTGFRLSRGGACEYLNIDADLVCLGKIAGGGLPLAAFGGRREIMSSLSPMGPVYQAGTLSGNPLAVAAGRATLSLLDGKFYETMEKIGSAVENQLRGIVEERGLSFNRVGSMFTIFFRSSPPSNFSEVGECDFDAFGRFHRLGLERGVYFPPSQYEAAFLSFSMTKNDVAHLGKVVTEVLNEMG
jgi:glutamate-1-semialdehyde 2,1-aminomutase